MCFFDLAVAYAESSRVLNTAVTQAEEDIWYFDFFGARDETTNSPLFDEAMMSVSVANSVAAQLSKIWFDMAVFFGQSRGMNTYFSTIKSIAINSKAPESYSY